MDGGVEFWVSVNRDSGHAVVHRDTCVYVQGKDGDSLGLEWNGPYGRIGEAAHEGTKLGVRLVRNCQLCREQTS